MPYIRKHAIPSRSSSPAAVTKADIFLHFVCLTYDIKSHPIRLPVIASNGYIVLWIFISDFSYEIRIFPACRGNTTRETS